MRRISVKNIVLKTITWIMAIAFILAACAVDSESIIPAIICGVSLTWLVPITLINHRRFKRW